MSRSNLGYLLNLAIYASLEAGKSILEIYNNSQIGFSLKDDNSPLTMADQNSHNKISGILNQTNIPILSEEGINIPFEERKEWEKFWLIDPLDGTKEFVKKNGEFTVNIALMELP